MKYLLTESRTNDIIKRFILKSFPEVSDVFFTNKKITLGATTGHPVVVRTIINVVINNSNNELSAETLMSLKRQIVGTVDKMFSLKHEFYGSEWDFQFFQHAICQLGTVLPKIK
jgi:hypothetical protein